jgi:acyl transferase domain-containing protein
MTDTNATERRNVLMNALGAIERLQGELERLKAVRREPIAIIGLGCRLPGGADSPEAFWELLQNGGDAIVEIPAERWSRDLYYDPDPEAPGKICTRHGGFLQHVDLFDAHFFGITPREALSMDPQQRLLLEVCWEAIEHAGYAAAGLADTRTGVYAGITLNDYGFLQKFEDAPDLNAYHMTGNHLSYAAGRIAYTLKLQGPALAVDTACSSSLVAVHLACQQLRAGECDMALAGGVNLILSPLESIMASKARMLSTDGRCRTFAARADGFGRGEGCGVVVLKRLADAQRAGDSIHAVIRGSAINHNGASSGLTVPNPLSQQEIIRQALECSGADPATIQYIEAHGTATPLGDPIEVRALDAVFRTVRSPADPLLVGSVKTNLGHLESAAGITGLIKIVLALQHRQIPANLHFDSPNPRIDWDHVCVAVPRTLCPWPPSESSRRAGVSSFGASGTNAHAIVEEAPAPAETPSSLSRPLHLLALSAATPDALKHLRQAYRGFLEKNAGINLADACYTANSGRNHFAHRQTFTAPGRDEMVEALSDAETSAKTPVNGPEALEAGIVFLFTGQGSQYPAMGRQLYETQPLFRKILDQCEQLFRAQTNRSLLAILFAQTADAAGSIHRTGYAQPALFALEYALQALWVSWGIRPAAVMGHSVGEVVAACVAGVFSLEEGLKLISARARLMQELPPGGAMAAVMADEARVQAVLAQAAPQLSIAALNGPQNTVISGPQANLTEALRALEGAGIRSVPLNVSHAFHSRLMEPMCAEFGRIIADIQYSPPHLPLVSNVSGGLLAPGDVPDSAYWVHHVRQPVRFHDSLQALHQQGYRIFLEIGPHPVLSEMGARGLRDETLRWMPSLRRGRDDWPTLLGSLAELYRSGAQVDWAGFDRGYARRRIPLPTYPFERRRYWRPSAYAPHPKGTEAPALLSGGLQSPLADTVVFEAPVSTVLYPFLDDHRIAGLTIVPAAFYLELLAAAGKRITGGPPAVLRDVVLHRPLILEEGEERRVQLVMSHPQEGAGTFKLIGLHGRPSPQAPWDLIASGQVDLTDRPAVSSAAAIRRETIEKRCRRTLDPDAFYARLHRSGYQFGAAFRGIQTLHADDREAIARIALPAEYREPVGFGEFPPPLLDACLQAGAAIWPDEIQDDLYLPISIGSFRLCRQPRGVLWSHAVVESRPRVPAETWATDYVVFDDSGNRVAELSGVVVKRAAGDFLQAASRTDVSGWLYRIEWEPVAAGPDPDAGASAVLIPALVQSAAGRLASLDRELHFSSNAGLFAELDHLCREYILKALAALGWTAAPGAAVDPRAMAGALGISSRHRRFWGRLIEILREDGILEEGAEGLCVAVRPADFDPEARLQALQARFPAAAAELSLTAHIGRNLAGALQGHTDPLDLLFPEGSTASAEKLYRDSPYLTFYNRMLRDCVADIQAGLPAPRTLRILEIGAGTGGTTSHLLPRLDALGTEYDFTDVSPLFLAKAKAKFAAYPFVRYALLDIEKEPQAQGFERQRYDVIIAANVLHATQDLKVTLGNVRRLLAPQGVLLLLEGTRRQRYADMIVGLTEGWWRFTDTDLRPDYPLIDGRQWQALLVDSGFAEAAVIPGNDLDADLFTSQAVILAQGPQTSAGEDAPPETRVERWVIFSDRGGLGDRLAAQLEADGRPSHRIYPTDAHNQGSDSGRTRAIDPFNPQAFESVWRELAGKPHGTTGVVYLWGADGQPAAGAAPEELDPSVESITAGALHLIQTLTQSELGETARVWLVTRGVQSVAGESPAVALASSPLWGLGRTVMLEHPGLHCRLIDLPVGPEEEMLEGLLQEVHARDRENQTAWRNGRRLAARLKPIIGKPWDMHGEMRLENTNPGTIEGVILAAADLPGVHAGQLRVRVRAAGLNFRDVLMALGAYPGESNPLGIEFAGTVEAAGPETDGFNAGEAVMGIAPGCFATFALADQRLVIRKPDRLTFEEAAAIPSIFMTAHHALLELAQLKQGERVLIHAAAGGVGMAALQVAKQVGAEIYATAGSDSKRQLLRSLGVREVFDSRSVAFAEQILRATHNAGVDVVLNSLSGEFIAHSFSTLGTGGRFVEIGRRGIWTDEQVASRRPDVQYFCVDLMNLCRTEPGRIQALLQTVAKRLQEKVYQPPPIQVFALGEAQSAFRHMAQAKHVGKIVLSHQRPDPPIPIREKGCYLITGGLRGLGLRVAQWLAGKGAGHLILLGRRPPDQETRDLLDRLEAQAVRIDIVQGDVSCLDDLQRAAAFIGDRTGLNGIFHCAGTLSDGVLVKQTWERFRSVMAAKVAGAWNLHRLSSGMPLDLFVLFSSAVSVIGSAGQANHAAACAFEDALAVYRRRLGLPGISINWGPWSEVGAAAGAAIHSRWQAMGVFAFPPSAGLQALEALLQNPAPQITVLKADWTQFLRTRPDSPMFRMLRATARPAGEPLRTAAQAPELSLRGVPEAEKGQIVRQFVERVIRMTMELEVGFELNPRQGLSELGMDSLLSIELRNHLQRGTGMALPATLAFDYPTIDALVALILSKQRAPGQVGMPVMEAEPAPSAVENAIDSLTEEEAEALLLSELGAGERKSQP